ncbi:hypothetical protein GOEFS_109_00070 [Gordonia effusa NBRC 100432]|uniref:Uncharacterized protein n=1 Tax=Gordonia effusa NBRC 100432 TaxID=1077974 RepID=H0R5B1_9ACTN|nr:hypothetical protein GOEFS_109_00070 [Gordonia effusa NBRC 100432]
MTTKRSGMTGTDPLVVHDDIRHGVNRFRPLGEDSAAGQFTLRVARSTASFTAPTLLALAEQARTQHQTIHSDTATPPIYHRVDDEYRWWTGQITGAPSDMATRVRQYAAWLYGVSVSHVTVSGGPPPTR